MMTEDEVARLAALGTALRPTWAASSLRTFIARHVAHNRAYGDTAVALSWIATKTKTETPRLLLEPGPWWKAALMDADPGGAVTNGRLDPTSACDTCSLPAHRHGPTSGHEFVSVVEAVRSRDTTPKPRLPRTKEVPQ